MIKHVMDVQQEAVHMFVMVVDQPLFALGNILSGSVLIHMGKTSS